MDLSKNQTFNFLINRIRKKLKGWKMNTISYAGRTPLIKAIAHVIPTCIMSSFSIPNLYWKKWAELCKPKHEEGLGFRNLRDFNEAMISKQGWRLLTNPKSLVSKTRKDKYY